MKTKAKPAGETCPTAGNEGRRLGAALRLSGEMAYVLGLVILAFSTAMMEKANFGVSMVVAPAYLLHRWVSQTWDWFTFGVAEYVFQGILLMVLVLAVRRWKWKYLFSFVTAVLYGIVLDGCIRILSWIPAEVAETVALRLGLYLGGMVACALGVALMFCTYLSPEVYELFVKETAETYGWRIPVVKTVYDCTSCFLAVCMSFAIFGLGQFVGVQWGTMVCALCNGALIGFWKRWMDKHLVYCAAFPKLRDWFST